MTHTPLKCMTEAQARAKGFDIDTHCNPPVAYKGTRFSPTEWHYLMTDAEAERDALKQTNAELLEALNEIAQWHDGEVGSHMDEPDAAQTARAAIARAEKGQTE